MNSLTDISGSFKLHNGVNMPYLGLGVYQSHGREAIDAIHCAIETGYRHIDTASFYQNEDDVGKAVRTSGIPRSEMFVVSKVWNADQGYANTIKACHESLKRLNMDYMDLYLVHWPLPHHMEETWKAMEQLYQEKKVRAIGVSNFLQHHLERLISSAKIVPMVNQMECHPWLVQQSLMDFCENKGIQYEAWSPIIKGAVNNIPLLNELAKKYGKTAVQVTLRWELQKNVITIPKSVKKERIISNADLFDFEISAEDMARIDQLDQGKRIGPDPDHVDF